MVADLMACRLDSRNQFWVAQSAFANEEERRLRVMALENIEDLGSEGRVRTIVERERHQGKFDSCSIDYVWSEPFEHTNGSRRLYPEHKKPNCDDENTAYQEKHLCFCYPMKSFQMIDAPQSIFVGS